MGIEGISNNFFPFDPEKKPTSIVATSSLVVTVVSAILIGVACGLSWGVPAIATLAAIGVVAVVVTLAIVLCKGKGTQRQLPISSQHLSQAFDQTRAIPATATTQESALKQLYTLVKKGDLQAFKQAVALYNAPELFRMVFTLHTITRDPDDQSSTLPHGDGLGRSLFHIILFQNDQAKKIQLLTMVLERLEDNSFGIHGAAASEFLKIRSQDFVSLCAKKFDRVAWDTILDLAWKEPHRENVWIDKFFERWEKEGTFQKASDERMCMPLMHSSLNKASKLKYLNKLVAQNGTTLDKFVMFDFEEMGSISHSAICSNLLRLAIDAEDIEMVKELAAYKSLINYPVKLGEQQEFTPLHRAVLTGNLEIVKILLAAGADSSIKFAGAASWEIAKHVVQNEDMAVALMVACKSEKTIIKHLGQWDQWPMKSFAEYYHAKHTKKPSSN